MAYIYKHIRKDTNEVFYIGIGKSKNHKRAYENQKRNNHWNNIIKKTDFHVEIIEDDISWKDACDKEKYWIKYYGRLDLNEGTLVNMTDGGDGLYNPSLEWRKNASKRNKGKSLLEETKQKISKSLMHHHVSDETREKIKKDNLNNPRSYWLGKKRPDISELQKGRVVSDETKQKQREAKLKNPTNYWLGKSRKGMKQNHPTHECLHCGKIGKGTAMFKWHFDNCKKKSD
jgi:hypothetical protein